MVDERIQKMLGPVAPVLRDLDNAAKFRTIPGVPLMAEHAPKAKANRAGEVHQIGASASELLEMARNSNAQVAAGRPPAAHLGHHPRDGANMAEGDHPKHIGWVTNFVVRPLNGSGPATLHADLKVRPAHYDEACTYPYPSIERVGYASPGQQAVRSLALLRRQPDQAEVGPIPYSAEPRGPRVPAGAMSLIEFARARRIYNPELARLRYTEYLGELAAAPVNYAAALTSPAPAPPSAATVHLADPRITVSREIVAMARKQGLTLEEARRRWLHENSHTEAGIHYAAAESYRHSITVDAQAPPRGNAGFLAGRPTAPAGPPPLTQGELSDKTETWSLPPSGSGLRHKMGTRAFQLAVREFSRENNVYDQVKAGDQLVEEIRGGLIGFNAQGTLLYPKPPANPDPAVILGLKPGRVISASEHYQRRKDIHWAKVASDKSAAERAAAQRREDAALLKQRSGRTPWTDIHGVPHD